jgi:hypothetical protein
MGKTQTMSQKKRLRISQYIPPAELIPVFMRYLDQRKEWAVRGLAAAKGAYSATKLEVLKPQIAHWKGVLAGIKMIESDLVIALDRAAQSGGAASGNV